MSSIFYIILQKFLMNPLVMVLICFVTLFLIRYYGKSPGAIFLRALEKYFVFGVNTHTQLTNPSY
jgi:hypothetical protein